MIKIAVRSIWNGQCGIREKYLAEADEKHEGFVLKYGKDIMVIGYPDVHKLIVGISKESFQDRYSSEWHHLVYYQWKPDKDKQIKLI